MAFRGCKNQISTLAHLPEVLPGQICVKKHMNMISQKFSQFDELEIWDNGHSIGAKIESIGCLMEKLWLVRVWSYLW